MSITACDTDLFACGWEGDCHRKFSIEGGSQIVLRPEQLSNLGISSAVTLGAAATIPFSSGCETPSTAPTPVAEQKQCSGASAGTITAATVGAMAGIFLVAAAGFYITSRWGKKVVAGDTAIASATQTPGPEHEHYQQGHNSDNFTQDQQQESADQQSRHRLELDGKATVAELHA